MVYVRSGLTVSGVDAVQMAVARRRKSKVRRQFEELKHLWPLAGALIGVCLVESNLALIPWKILGILLASISAAYLVSKTWRLTKKEESKVSGKPVIFSSPAKHFDIKWNVQLEKPGPIEVILDKRPIVPTEITAGRYCVTLTVERL